MLAVPQGGGWAFIDPATPYLPTGRLPGPLQGQRGVLIRGNHGELIDLPIDKPQDNTRDVNYELGLGVFRHVDVVIGCLDNREARLSLNRASWAVNPSTSSPGR